MVIVYGLMFGLFVAYSHPAIRLKKRPARALVTVAVGQGVLGFSAGWLTAQPHWTTLVSSVAIAGGVAATLLTTGLYPLTGLYQVEEDRARGDRTAAVAWGVQRCFGLATGLLGAAGCVLLIVVTRRYGASQVALLVPFYAALLALLVSWWRRFDTLGVLGNYKK